MSATVECCRKFLPELYGTIIILENCKLSDKQKWTKYERNNICIHRYFVENLGALSTSAMEFLNALGRRIPSVSGEDRESAFLFHFCQHSTLQ